MGEATTYDSRDRGVNAVKRALIVMGAVALVSALFVGDALAVTSAPAAPVVDVFAYAKGIFDSITANLTALLTFGGLLAGVGWVMRRVSRSH